MSFTQRGNISKLKGGPSKLVNKFAYLGSSVSSTENDINTWLSKAWTAIDKLLVIWKLNLIDKIKRLFSKAAVVSILLYRCTTWILTKRLEKKLDSNYTRMLQAILNKTWRQHPAKQHLYGHLSSITKTIKDRRSRHAGHRWRSKEEHIRDILLWNPTNGPAKVEQPARTFIQLLCANTGCSLEDLQRSMDDRDGWRERVREIRIGSATWLWWWWYYP